MKIALLAPSDKSFVKEFLSNSDKETLPKGYMGAPFIGTLINEFLLLGHEVVAITTTEAIENDYSIKHFKNRNFSWIVVPFRPNSIKNNGKRLGRILDGFAFEQRQMVKVIKEIQPDFVHAHWSYEFAGAAIKSKLPFLITVHDNPFVILKYFKNVYRFGRLLMAEYNLKKVKFATTVSPYMLEYVSKRCENVEVIPNPIKINFTKENIKELIKEKISTLNSPRIFMINNGWEKRKNGKKGLIAFKFLQKVFPKSSLHLYGGGSEKEGEAYLDARDLNLKNVNYNGIITRKKLMEDLKTAHLLLHPALEESFGVVLIEAMSMGIPAIGGKSSGAVPWVIGEPRLLVDVKKEGEMQKKMIELLSDETIYKDLAMSGFKNVETRFSSNAVATAYLNCYIKVLKDKR
jgi:glycosyltransferase involved in cell wall biosynthesis